MALALLLVDWRAGLGSVPPSSRHLSITNTRRRLQRQDCIVKVHLTEETSKSYIFLDLKEESRSRDSSELEK